MFHIHDFVYTRAMAAKPAPVSCVRELVDELVAMVGGGWTTTIDQPFAITRCTGRTVIFDLCLHMEVGDENPVVMRDDVIGRRLRWEGVLRAMALVKQEDAGPGGSSSLSRDQKPATKNEDALRALFEVTANDLDSEEESRSVKRMVDLTLGIEELRAKRRRGGRH